MPHVVRGYLYIGFCLRKVQPTALASFGSIPYPSATCYENIRVRLSKSERIRCGKSAAVPVSIRTLLISLVLGRMYLSYRSNQELEEFEKLLWW